MPKKRNGQFWESLKSNNEQYIEYYNRLTELSISMFKWNNLPDSIDPRYLELGLFADGHMIFFYDEDIGHLCLRGALGGTLDVYGIPTYRTAYSTNGYQRHLDETNSVIIWNNLLHTNSVLTVETFSKRLYDIDRAIDINAKAQKTPVLVTCDESERLTFKNLYMKYEGNEPVIFGEKAINPNSIAVLKTDAPYVADKLYQLRSNLWNEALTYLGISNSGPSKRERLITSEMEKSSGGTIASRYSRLTSRQECCEKINKMFGLNISVEYRDDMSSNEQLDINELVNIEEEDETNE